MKLLYLLICRVTSLAGWFGSDWSKGFGSPFFFFFAAGRCGWSVTTRLQSATIVWVLLLSRLPGLRFAPTEPVSVCWCSLLAQGPEGSGFPLVFIATGSRQVQLGGVLADWMDGSEEIRGVGFQLRHETNLMKMRRLLSIL
jgi:hypothetical protein